ncbi:hypothetical protein BDN70DRAFT_980068 [Pholiota conissans]|uniref:Uncharacterized protein n=1 Tax=Pholiota conissans TaxID=109636 RepID=A0A9P5YL89_9AGAR|nr:hypothetical protein BDN70DRAFT_980068 [Pholiota conissans]
MGRCHSKVDIGDAAFDAGIEAFNEFKRLHAAQGDATHDAQAHLDLATKYCNTAIDHYRKKKNDGLGAALVNLAALKWELYKFSQTGDHSADIIDEIILLNNEAFKLWHSRDPKPAQYPILLANLAKAHRERFTMKTDLDQALRLYHDIRGIRTSSTEATRNYVEATMNIGATYWTRYYNTLTGTGVDDEPQIKDAIKYLKDAHHLSKGKYQDIQSSCLYELAWIHHHLFKQDEKQNHIGSAEDSLTKAILPMLLFHQYTRDGGQQNLEDARKAAQSALESPVITDETQKQTLCKVCEYNEAANEEAIQELRVAVRRTTLASFRSDSAEYSPRSPARSSIAQLGIDGIKVFVPEEKSSDAGEVSGAGFTLVTSEPQQI